MPFLRSIPYGVQHILAMFVANLAPISSWPPRPGLTTFTTGSLVQRRCSSPASERWIQLFPCGGLGSGLPIVMGISFTFVTVLCGMVATYGY